MEQLSNISPADNAIIDSMSDLSLNVYEELPVIPDTSDTLLMFIQEIWLCFNIDKFEMISDTKSGNLRLKRILFNRNISSDMLRQLIRDEIDNNCHGSSIYRYEIEVKFVAAKIRDIVLIDVIVYDMSNKPFTQRFLYQ